MIPTTPRDALERIGVDAVEDWPSATEILTALAPFLRTAGTVEVCELCGRRIPAMNGDPMCSGLYNQPCPIKQVTK